MSVITRFAPSPTGFLHIGSARTALFNWLFARHHGGTYLLRIEDTDRRRSTDAAIQVIFDGLDWLGLTSDAEPVFQSAQAAHHAKMVHNLLAQGKAYRCYCTPDELDVMRKTARAEGRPMRYDGTWRDRDPILAPDGIDPVIRFKAPREGETIIDDLVQGQVRIANDQLDDMVLLRADGSPTYMLSVVVDDHDMDITHVIRGDDHLVNAARQSRLFMAFGWQPPQFGHLPLIHGADGAKLSKRHGALGVDAYRDMGLLPEAVCNYLLRLGWSHGDDEVITIEQAITWFDLDAVGRSAARFDMAKLTNLNAHYLRLQSDSDLADLIVPILAEQGIAIDADGRSKLIRGMAGLKQRAHTMIDLADAARFYVRPRPLPITAKAAKLITEETRQLLSGFAGILRSFEPWREADLEALAREHAQALNMGLGKLAQPLRVALTGSNVSPGLFDVMVVLGRDDVLARIQDVVDGRNPASQHPI